MLGLFLKGVLKVAKDSTVQSLILYGASILAKRSSNPYDDAFIGFIKDQMQQYNNK